MTLVASALENIVPAAVVALAGASGVAAIIALTAGTAVALARASGVVAMMMALAIVVSAVAVESVAVDHNHARGYLYAEREQLYYFYSPHSDCQKVVVVANYYSYVQYPLFHPVDRSPCLRDRVGGVKAEIISPNRRAGQVTPLPITNPVYPLVNILYFLKILDYDAFVRSDEKKR